MCCISVCCSSVLCSADTVLRRTASASPWLSPHVHTCLPRPCPSRACPSRPCPSRPSSRPSRPKGGWWWESQSRTIRLLALYPNKGYVKHTFVSTCVSLSFHLAIYLCQCISVYLAICLSAYLWRHLSACLFACMVLTPFCHIALKPAMPWHGTLGTPVPYCPQCP